VNFESALICSAVVGDHQDKFGPELGAQQTGKLGRSAPLNPAMEFVAARDVNFVDAAIEVSRNGALHLR
jgi:hypothetical protein